VSKYKHVNFLAWDYILDKNSSEAAVYVAWERELLNGYFDYFPNPEVQSVISRILAVAIVSLLIPYPASCGNAAKCSYVVLVAVSDLKRF